MSWFSKLFGLKPSKLGEVKSEPVRGPVAASVAKSTTKPRRLANLHLGRVQTGAGRWITRHEMLCRILMGGRPEDMLR